MHAALLVVVLVVVSLSSASAATTVAPLAVPGIAAIRMGGDNYAQTHLPQYETVFLGPGRLADLSYIKQQSPGTRVLQWNDVGFLYKTCANPTQPTCPTAVSFNEALAHDQANPSDPWILRDAAGNPIGYRGFPNEVYANPGSASYQLRARTNMLRSLTASTPDWSGVNLDNVERNFYNSAGATIHGSAPSPAYPTNASWYPAVKSLFVSVGSYLRQQGFYLAGNAAVSGDATGAQTQPGGAIWPAPSTGTRRSTSSSTASTSVLPITGTRLPATSTIACASSISPRRSARTSSGGCTTTSSAPRGRPAPCSEALMYGEAAFKLKWDGSGGGYRMQQLGSIDPWNAAWTQNIGTPSGAMYAVSTGWRRDYTAGTVIVNPNAPTAGPITFNLGATYTDPNGNQVTSVTLQPVRAMILSKTAQPVGTTPANQAVPSISGVTGAGQTLNASSGSWSGSPTGYAYQWKRCTSAGSGCAAIAGATAAAYLLQSSDVDSTLRVTVTATNAWGSGSADSAATSVVTGTTPANQAVPSISGVTGAGQTLNASSGSWSGSPTGYAYQWKRCTSAGSGCAAIAGATAAAYLLQSSDVDSTLRVTVTATNTWGSGSADSAATSVVTGIAPANQAVPSISGVTGAGQTLNASSGSWSGSPTGYAYQWKRCTSAGSGCAAIAGATAAAYLLQSSDVDSTLRVTVTATNTWGSGSADSAATSIVTGETSYNDNITGTSLGQFTFVGTWKHKKNKKCYERDNHESKIRDSYYLFRFSGTQLKLYATKGASFGIGAYSIDGGAETLVDHYAPGRAGPVAGLHEPGPDRAARTRSRCGSRGRRTPSREATPSTSTMPS